MDGNLRAGTSMAMTLWHVPELVQVPTHASFGVFLQPRCVIGSLRLLHWVCFHTTHIPQQVTCRMTEHTCQTNYTFITTKPTACSSPVNHLNPQPVHIRARTKPGHSLGRHVSDSKVSTFFNLPPSHHSTPPTRSN